MEKIRLEIPGSGRFIRQIVLANAVPWCGTWSGGDEPVGLGVIAGPTIHSQPGERPFVFGDTVEYSVTGRGTGESPVLVIPSLFYQATISYEGAPRDGGCADRAAASIMRARQVDAFFSSLGAIPFACSPGRRALVVPRTISREGLTRMAAAAPFAADIESVIGDPSPIGDFSAPEIDYDVIPGLEERINRYINKA